MEDRKGDQEKKKNRKVNLKENLKTLREYRSTFSEVIFTHREPTLNPDLIILAQEAKKLNYKKISLITNGRRLSYRPYLLKLIKSGINEFIISIHGHKKEIHEAQTRTPGSFSQTRKGLENLTFFQRRFHFNLITATTLNKLNYLYLKEIILFLEQFNPEVLVFNMVRPLGPKIAKYFNVVIPSYQEVSNKIREVSFSSPHIFQLRRGKKRRISFVDFPLCFAGEFENLIGQAESVFFQEEGRMKEYDVRTAKIKRKECKKCKYFSKCEGIYRNYVTHFGWQEFKPVK